MIRLQDRHSVFVYFFLFIVILKLLFGVVINFVVGILVHIA